MKIVGAVEYCTEYIDEVPIELFPSLVSLLQGGGVVKIMVIALACSRCISLFVGGMRNCFTQADLPWDTKPTVAVASRGHTAECPAASMEIMQ